MGRIHHGNLYIQDTAKSALATTHVSMVTTCVQRPLAMPLDNTERALPLPATSKKNPSKPGHRDCHARDVFNTG